MAKRSFTEHPKRRAEDAGFNPVQEVEKIVDFDKEAGLAGCDNYTVYVEDGILTYSPSIKPKKTPGFIAVLSRTKFGAGLTKKAWRKLEQKVAIELTKQRKAW